MMRFCPTIKEGFSQSNECSKLSNRTVDALRSGEQFCYDTFCVQYASSMPNWVEGSGFKKQGTASDFDFIYGICKLPETSVEVFQS